MSIWFGQPTLDDITPLNKGTVGEVLGIEFSRIGDDALEATLTVDDRVVLAESVCSVGASLTLDPNKQYAVGQEINANHIRPGILGDVITAHATPVSRGRRSQVWDIRLHNQHDKLVCISRCTIAIVNRTD